MDGWVGAPRQTAVLYGSWVLEWQCQSRSDHSAADSRRACFHSHVHMFTLSARKKANNLSEAFPGMFSLVKSFPFCLFCMFVFFCQSLKRSQWKEKYTSITLQTLLMKENWVDPKPGSCSAAAPSILLYNIFSCHILFKWGRGERKK